MRKIWIALAIVLIIIISIVLAAPPLIKNYFNNHSKEITGRKGFVQSLSFNPFKAAVSIEDFKFFEKNDSAIFFSLDSIYLNINFMKLIIGKIELEEIRLVNPRISVIQESDSFNFNDLLESEDSIPSEESSENTEFVLKEIYLVNGEISFFDKNVDNKIDFNDLNLYLPIIAWDSKSAKMGIDLKINKTGRIEIANNYFPEKNAIESQIKLTGIDISLAKPYLKPYLVIDSIGGKLNCNINLLAEFSNTNTIVITGNSSLTGFVLADSSSIPLISADSIDFQIEKIDLLNSSFKLNKAFIDKPFLRFDLMDSTNSVFNMLALADEGTDTIAVADSSSSELYYSVDTLILANGAIKYRDYSLDEYYEYNITQIISQSNNLSSTAEELTLSFGGLINNHGNFTALVTVNPSKEMDFNIEFQVEGFQMVDFSPLSLYYAGYPVFEGVLVYSGKTVVKDFELNSQNKVTIYDLALGDKIGKKVLYAIPLKFAIFLLKDKNGVVNLELPIGGNINDPKFKIGKIIWQIIKQNAQKVVAAPGKALANKYGFSEEEIRFVEFEPDESNLNIRSTATLDKLMQIASDKKELTIGLKYDDNMVKDKAAIALAQSKLLYVQQNLKAENSQQAKMMAANLSGSDKLFLSFMKSKTNSESNNPDSLALQLITDEQILEIVANDKTEREKAVLHYISLKNDSIVSQFTFVEDNEMPTFIIEKPGFEVKFNLKEKSDAAAADGNGEQ